MEIGDGISQLHLQCKAPAMAVHEVSAASADDAALCVVLLIFTAVLVPFLIFGTAKKPGRGGKSATPISLPARRRNAADARKSKTSPTPKKTPVASTRLSANLLQRGWQPASDNGPAPTLDKRTVLSPGGRKYRKTSDRFSSRALRDDPNIAPPVPLAVVEEEKEVAASPLTQGLSDLAHPRTRTSVKRKEPSGVYAYPSHYIV